MTDATPKFVIYLRGEIEQAKVWPFLRKRYPQPRDDVPFRVGERILVEYGEEFVVTMIGHQLDTAETTQHVSIFTKSTDPFERPPMAPPPGIEKPVGRELSTGPRNFAEALAKFHTKEKLH